jgi:hypothetical protein
METSDIISSLKRILNETSTLLKAIEPEKCSCHERDSSYVCDVCYRQGMRGHMQEGGESKWCDDCGLYTDGPVCEFCGRNTETREVRRW